MTCALALSRSDAFSALFEALDGSLAELHIAGYSVEMTTLEEVFLRLAQEGDKWEASTVSCLSSCAPSW